MYTKTSWVARVGTALNRFLKTNETSTEVELTNDPTGVTTAGTPFTVANMNKIEQGIYDAHVVLDNNINQGVKTTDSPYFANMNPPVDNNDASMPSVGIGGFSYAVDSTSTQDAYPSITIGGGGTWVYIALSTRGSTIYTVIGRIAGGSSVQGQAPASSQYGTVYVYVIAWRIA